MAYGKGQQRDALKRMADLGRAPNTSDLAKLRALHIEACNSFAESIWPTSVLDDIATGKDLDKAMLLIQSTMKGTLNSVWAEKARLSVKAAVTEQIKRAKGNLFGRFKHLSTTGEKPMRCGTRRLVNFPEEWSTRLSENDLAELQTLADSMDYRGTIELFRKLETGKPTSSLPSSQAEALLAMLGMVKERYGKPAWKLEDSVVQIHLDFRCMPGGREAQDSLLRRLTQAANSTLGLGMAYSTPFLVSGVIAREAPLKLDVVIRPDVVQRLLEPVPDATDARFTSMVLEIGPEQTVVKGVLSQHPKPFGLDEAEHLLGTDFGMVSTAAAALVKVDAPLDADWLLEARDWTKKQAKAYLETHAHDGEAVETMLFSGRNFLARVEGHAKHVDRLRSEIDRNYNRLNRLKHEANRILGSPADTQLDLDLVAQDKRLADLLARFSRLLGVIHRLKLLRRQVYRAVGGLKKSWFGFVTTKLAEMCRGKKAAYVRENLNIFAVEKKSPDYKGRIFNKMLNNGSKGQFLRRMTGKLQWYGVPEIVVPSYYTSSTDVRHSVVDSKQRRGEVFTSRVDGRQMNADLHAGLTLALWPLLRPREPLSQAA